MTEVPEPVLRGTPSSLAWKILAIAALVAVAGLVAFIVFTHDSRVPGGANASPRTSQTAPSQSVPKRAATRRVEASARSAAERYLTALVAHDFGVASSLLCAAQHTSAASIDASIGSAEAQAGSLQSSRILAETRGARGVTVRYLVTYERATATWEVYVVEESGGWLLCGSRFLRSTGAFAAS